MAAWRHFSAGHRDRLSVGTSRVLDVRIAGRHPAEPLAGVRDGKATGTQSKSATELQSSLI